MHSMEEQETFVASLIGKSVEEAKNEIAQAGSPIDPYTGAPTIEPWLVRIRSVVVNGKETARKTITMDARADRINLWIVDGKITHALIG